MHGYQIVEEPCSSRYAALDVVTDRHNDKVVEDPSCVHHYCCRPWMQRLDEAAAVGSEGARVVFTCTSTCLSSSDQYVTAGRTRSMTAGVGSAGRRPWIYI